MGIIVYRNSTFLAIVPARSGSKRLPGKNVRELCGKPLIAWSIEAGIQSKYVDKVAISTDSQEYANIALKYGAEVPYLRPLELSQDTSTTLDVLKHMIVFYKDNLNKRFDYVALLQPTNPTRKSAHLDEAIKKLLHHQGNAIIGVCPCEHSPLWSNTLSNDERMDNFINPNIYNIRSQDLPTYYRLNGAIYIAQTEWLMQSKSLFGKNTYAYKMTLEESVDIDNEIDFKLAEAILQQWNK